MLARRDRPPLSYYCYCDPRYIHSFPTRRSSDLRTPRCSYTTAPSNSSASSPSRSSTAFARCVRSEEHTSELQSQSNLVCRLLLEKKKLVAVACWHSGTLLWLRRAIVPP